MRTAARIVLHATRLHFISKYCPLRAARKLTFHSETNRNFICAALLPTYVFWSRNAPPIGRPAATGNKLSVSADRSPIRRMGTVEDRWRGVKQTRAVS